MKPVLSKNQLRKRALEVDLSTAEGEKNAKRIINEMKEELRKNESLCAICAPQIGEDARIVCLKFSDGDIRTLINPVVELELSARLSREKQPLQSGDTEYLVPRSDSVQVIYQTPTGKTEHNAFEGVASMWLQQMIQLIDGTLLEDIGMEILEGYDELDEDEKQTIVAMYLQTLKNIHKFDVEKYESDPEAKKMGNALEFSQRYMAGMIETIPLTEEEKRKVAEYKKKECERNSNIGKA